MDELPDTSNRKSSTRQTRKACTGFIPKLPCLTTPRSAYPFALHERLGDPWNVAIISGKLILHARTCLRQISINPDSESGPERQHHGMYSERVSLSENTALLGILDCLQDGVKPHCPFYCHGVGGTVQILRDKTSQVRALRLNRLGEARKLLRKATTVSSYKEWVMAVGSGRVERIHRLVKVALDNHRGIRGLLDV